MKILHLTEDMITLLKMGSAINNGGECYYFLPFWFKEVGDGKFEVHKLGSLPFDLSNSIESIRSGTSDQFFDFPVTPIESIDGVGTK